MANTILHFDKSAKPFNSKMPVCQISDISCGSMRFRWDETNPNRKQYFSKTYPKLLPIDIELCHSQEVICIQDKEDIDSLKNEKICADGILTQNSSFLPIITVADCMPIFVYDDSNGMFGVLHSGWKGTGIVFQAIKKAIQVFSSSVESLHFILGPHIRECCYLVDEQRAQFFINNFTTDCVKPTDNPSLFSLSLEKANLSLLQKANIPEEHIVCSGECTCCTQLPNSPDYKYGSFRRQKVINQQDSFTTMAASISLEINS